MISDKMAAAINEQINAELYSAYLYKSMAAFAADAGYPGMTNWLNIQTLEELSHADMFMTYLQRVSARVLLTAIATPPAEFESALHVYEETLAHEGTITARINKLVDLAKAESDHATQVMLQWFVNEQVEEEENASNIIDEIKLAGPQGYYWVDKELAKRVFTPPAVQAT